MDFEIIGSISNSQTIATGRSIRELQNLNKLFGNSSWRKLKGEANIKLSTGNIRRAEVHWYEAHGIGKRKMKIKRFID